MIEYKTYVREWVDEEVVFRYFVMNLVNSIFYILKYISVRYEEVFIFKFCFIVIERWKEYDREFKRG